MALGQRGRTVPVGNVLVSDTRCHVEHDNTALAVDVVSITKTTKLLLTSSVPDIELDRPQVLYHVRQIVPIPYLKRKSEHTVVKPRGWTSTPRVAMYFFSNSPVK
jgi:hypothetical protein